MLTRCPHCQTAFRVTHEQLIPRQGKVRCGSCMQVFNALESLSDEAVVVVAPEPAFAELPDQEVVAEEAGQPELEIVPTPWPFPLPQPIAEAPEPAPESESEVEAVPEPLPEPVTELEPEPEVEPEAESWPELEAETPPRRWPWVAGFLMLLLLAGVQLAYIYRVELAVLAPDLRPGLTAVCQAAGCEVPHPRRPELVGIESSDLTPSGQERLHLTAVLRNRAPFAQEYPHLELTLTDTDDQPLLRKVLTPADYLPAGLPPTPFAARDEVAVSLFFETPGLQPVGYRLYLFYP